MAESKASPASATPSVPRMNRSRGPTAREVGQWLLDIIAEWGRAPHLFRWPQEFKGMDGPSEEEVLVDRPEEDSKVTRVTGPFSVEATIPTPLEWDESGEAVGPGSEQRELAGLDVFDPITMEVEHRSGDDVPAWFLDTDYNGLCFHVCQAFFPRTGAWDNLKKSLRASYEESVWDHLASAASAPFEAGEHKQAAVKVIDDRGNELLVVRNLSEAS